MSDLSVEVGRSILVRHLTRITLPGIALGLAAALSAATGQGKALDIASFIEVFRSLQNWKSGAPPNEMVWFLAGSAIGTFIAHTFGLGIQRWWFRSAQAPRLKLWKRIFPRGRLFELYVRLRECHGLSMSTIWPKVWITLQEGDRQELHQVRASIAAASIHLGWGLSWVLLGAFWWPGSIVGIIFFLYGFQQFRSHSQDYAILVERHAVDRCADLAVELGLTQDAMLRKQVGFAISAFLEDPRKFDMLQRLRSERRLARTQPEDSLADADR